MTRQLQRILASLTLLLAGAHAMAAELVYVGTQASQIHALRFEPSTGNLAPLGAVALGGAPTWVLAHPRLPVLYATNDKAGSVSAYAVNRESGALAAINEAPAGGAGTTYLSLDATAATLFAANYGGGSASSIVVNGDGSLGALVSTMQGAGSGPHRRQASAHAHSVGVDPGGRYVLVQDIGADRVFVYGYDRATRALSRTDRSFVVPPGSGPRHFVFAGSQPFVYVINELTAEIMVLRWDGRLAPVQTVPLSGAEFQGTRSASGIAASADGRYIYAVNRGEHALQVYRADAVTGALSFVQRIGSGGEVPWALGLDPSGKWLMVANQRSGKVNLFAVDAASGILTDSGQSASVPSPVSIAFVR